MNELLDLELELEELNNIFDISSTVSDYLENMSIEGVCQNDIKILNNLLGLEENPNYPIKSYTLDKSFINAEIAQESFIDALIAGIRKMLELILKSISNFFRRLGEIIDNIADVFRKKKKSAEKERVDAVITAIQKNSNVIDIDGKKVENEINDKKVTGVYVEKLIDMAFKDQSGTAYKTIEEIMREFFEGDLTDKKWKSYIRSNDKKMKAIADYSLAWWNTTHPIVATEGNKSFDFIVTNVEIINYIVEKLINKLNWWLSRISALLGVKTDQLENAITALLDEKDKETVLMNNQLRSKLDGLFKPLNFMSVQLGDEPFIAARNALDIFKRAKVDSKSRLTFIESLNSLEWVSGIDELQSKMNEGNKSIERSKKEAQLIINQIKKDQTGMSRALSAKVGKFIKDMQIESQNLIVLATVMLSFITFIQEKIDSNREHISKLHMMIVYMGIDIRKHLQNN